MADMLTSLKQVSLNFQKDDLYLPDIPSLIMECKDQISEMHSEDGVLLRKFNTECVRVFVIQLICT